MNCNNVQQRLLGSTDPQRVPDALQPHLTECAACRDWHAKLVRIEQAVPLLPVAAPRPSAKADLVRRFETLGRVRSARRRPVLALGWPTWAAGLAASVLILSVGGWLMFGGRKGTPIAKADPPDPFLAKLVERNVELAKDGKPDKKLELLAALADDLYGESRNLARVAGGEELDSLAGLYAKVVGEGIVKQAQALPEGDRRAVEKLADRMREAGQSAERLAQEVPNPSVKPLRTIAEAAQDADRKLRDILAKG